jgi:hypothetical protein
MVALQKSLMEQTDIVPTLKEFVFETDQNNELVVANPPTQILFSDEPAQE